MLVGGIATAIIPINFFVIVDPGPGSLKAFTVLALAQLVLGTAAVITALRYRAAAGRGGIGMAIGFGLVGLGGPVGLGLVIVGLAMAGGAGGAWGRPLRVRGRILHPELRLGSDWSRGACPTCAISTVRRGARSRCCGCTTRRRSMRACRRSRGCRLADALAVRALAA